MEKVFNNIGDPMPERDSSPILSKTAAATLREKILHGEVPAGAPLRELHWAEALNVSRNTLREAFQQLSGEGLVEHRAHHGTFVRRLEAVDIHEIYTIRLTLELQGIERSASAPKAAIEEMIARVERVQRAAIDQDWQLCGTASLEFHRQLVAFIGSPRLDDLFSSVAAQARIVFGFAPDARRFQEPWVLRDLEICNLICDGNRPAALRALKIYLQESEQLILEAARAHEMTRAPRLYAPHQE